MRAYVAAGVNLNGCIIIYDEMPYEMIGANGGEAERMLKQMLSTGTIVADVFQKDKEGKRVSTRITVECQAVFLGCSNLVLR